MVIPLLCSIFIISIVIFYGSKRTSPHRYFSSSKTCLKSYNASILHQTLYHFSVAHNNAPPTLNYWKSGLKDGLIFMWKNKPKERQYVHDGIHLKGIPMRFSDLVLTSHILEHIANPFKALVEWIRIIRPRDVLVLLLVLSFKERTCDHQRVVVQLEHLINDYRNRTSECDLSNLNEILSSHDLARNVAAGTKEHFKTRSENDFQNRGLHQHVYDQELLYYMLVCVNLDAKGQFT
ncbi:unnamed protein product [Rotaria magnacalcarata]|uniref:Methyltransferase type 11 domain-containing protein n=1 Tax=Rotaria magnacalcarata TaxID=392030 RepID=A0A820EC07_9BILA|nr:unnamed protein product [Rotaria magnacalcarata]